MSEDEHLIIVIPVVEGSTIAIENRLGLKRCKCCECCRECLIGPNGKRLLETDDKKFKLVCIECMQKIKSENPGEFETVDISYMC